MTPKQRILISLNHQQPDRVPMFANLTPQMATKIEKTLNLPLSMPIPSFLSTRLSHYEVLLKLGNDAVGIGACYPTSSPLEHLEDGSMKDEWGIHYKRVGYYDEIIERPLSEAKSLSDVRTYRFPDPLAEGRYNFAKEMIRKYKDNFAIVADLECTIFELSWGLVGMEKFLIDLLSGKPYIFELMDKVAQFNIEVGRQLIKLGADIIWTGDDFGTQKGMLISPRLWREIFKPRMRVIFKEFKKANPNIKIAYHSCGSIVPIIEDLIEIGLDILNPIQPRANGMDLGILKQKYGEELSFFGGIDEQKILPFGSPHQVEEEVKKKIKLAGSGGGYILSPAHNIQPDTPVENVFKMYKTVHLMGQEKKFNLSPSV